MLHSTKLYISVHFMLYIFKILKDDRLQTSNVSCNMFRSREAMFKLCHKNAFIRVIITKQFQNMYI